MNYFYYYFLIISLIAIFLTRWWFKKIIFQPTRSPKYHHHYNMSVLPKIHLCWEKHHMCQCYQCKLTFIMCFYISYVSPCFIIYILQTHQLCITVLSNLRPCCRGTPPLSPRCSLASYPTEWWRVDPARHWLALSRWTQCTLEKSINWVKKFVTKEISELQLFYLWKHM